MIAFLRQSPNLRVSAQALVTVSPLLFDYVFAGTVGPATAFFFFALWLPVVTLAFAGIVGRRALGFAVLVMLFAAGLIAVLYPSSPAMGFQRTFVQTASPVLWAALMVIMLMQSFGPLKRPRT